MEKCNFPVTFWKDRMGKEVDKFSSKFFINCIKVSNHRHRDQLRANSKKCFLLQPLL